MSTKPRVMIGPHDVTEHVAQMYDAIVGSMDWGSEFLDWETILSILLVGKLAGFEYAIPNPPRDQVPKPWSSPEWHFLNRLEQQLQYSDYEARVAAWREQVKTALDAKAETALDRESCENVAVELLSHVESIRK